jgi:cytochrome c
MSDDDATIRALAGVLLVPGTGGAARGAERFGIGRPATEAEIAAWTIDIDRDGRKLPAGSGGVAHGREVVEARRASCHGNRGRAGPVSV